jgi:hypothetical protein
MHIGYMSSQAKYSRKFICNCPEGNRDVHNPRRVNSLDKVTSLTTSRLCKKDE